MRHAIPATWCCVLRRSAAVHSAACLQGSPRSVILAAVSPGGAAAPPRKGPATMLACDISSVLDSVVADVEARALDQESPQEYQQLCETVRAAPELFLGLAAMPLTLRKLPAGPLALAPVGDPYAPTRCVAVKLLRQATVVALLDTASCMREALGSGWGPSEVLERLDESGVRVPCLHVDEVRPPALRPGGVCVVGNMCVWGSRRLVLQCLCAMSSMTATALGIRIAVHSAWCFARRPQSACDGRSAAPTHVGACDAMWRHFGG